MQKIVCFLVNRIFGGTSGKYFVYLLNKINRYERHDARPKRQESNNG
jgi:hypothetical protein